MKRLFFIRHAKSSWDFAALPDIKRPLNDRGKRDAPKMASYLHEKFPTRPDLIISSPSVRTLATCKYFTDQYAYPNDEVRIEDAIYEASVSDIVSVLKTINDDVNSVFLFGHNPSITYFANECENFLIDVIPTCGFVVVDIAIESWKDFDFPACQVLMVRYPKMIV
ncbi:MAG: histidine phosphatase family protein [Saprospiraceae bacterium]|nr:histidine phosphatase family protein [Saprospiraceae bacterium]